MSEKKIPEYDPIKDEKKLYSAEEWALIMHQIIDQYSNDLQSREQRDLARVV